MSCPFNFRNTQADGNLSKQEGVLNLFNCSLNIGCQLAVPFIYFRKVDLMLNVMPYSYMMQHLRLTCQALYSYSEGIVLKYFSLPSLIDKYIVLRKNTDILPKFIYLFLTGKYNV